MDSRDAGRSMVVGGRGFVGSALVSQLTRNGTPTTVVARRAADRGTVAWDSPEFWTLLRRTERVFWTAGLSNHALPDQDFELARSREVGALKTVLGAFEGDLVLLSSQALYSGRTGVVPEELEPEPPTMPYGRLKLESEAVARRAFDEGRLSALRIHRLMYAFGSGEPSRRLIPRLAAAQQQRQRVRINGGGRSYLNPLPAAFVAAVLAESMGEAERVKGLFLQHVNSPETWTVRGVVEALVDGQHAEFGDEPEPWPVLFHGETAQFEQWTASRGMAIPDVATSLSAYWSMIGGQ